MDLILTSTMNEVYKIFSKKKFIFLFSVSIIATIAASVINQITGRSFGVSVFNLPITTLNFMSTIILPLFILMITSDLFSGEFSDKSIVMSLVRPITRNKLYISKILSVGISTLALLMGTLVISFIASLFGGDLKDIVYGMPLSFLSYVSAVVPMLLIAIITAFLAQFIKSGSLTVVIMVLASILMSTLSIFVPQAVPFLPTTYLTWYQNFYSGVNFITVLNELLFILAYGIIFLFAGTYVFGQKDI